jgi:hypothetical protein
MGSRYRARHDGSLPRLNFRSGYAHMLLLALSPVVLQASFSSPPNSFHCIVATIYFRHPMHILLINI